MEERSGDGGEGITVPADDYSIDRREVLKATAGTALFGGVAGGEVAAESVETRSADGTTVYIGTEDGGVYAVDAGTGTQQWRLDTGAPVISPPTVVDGTLYVGSGRTLFVESADGDSSAGALYAIDAETGEQEWAFTRPDTVFMAGPTVVDGTVHAGGTHTDTQSGTRYAIDADTGDLEWEFPDPPVLASSSANVVGGTAYFGAYDPEAENGLLYAVDAETGEQEWLYTEPSRAIVSSPTVTEGTVYVGADGLHAVDAETGSQEWVFPDGFLVGTSPTVVDGTVYFGSFDDSVYALEAETGAREWRFETSDSATSSPTVADGTVYAGSDDTSLYAIDAETGEQEWAFEEPTDRVRSSPTVSGGTVYVGANDGSLYAVDATSGTREWAFTDLAAANESAPTVVEEPQSGDSVGTRVNLGTLGHHHTWAGTEDDEETAPDVTGFHPPQIDGLPYGHAGDDLPEGKAGEWAEAHTETVDLLAADGPDLSAESYTKVVGNGLYFGLTVPPAERDGSDVLSANQLERIRLSFDRDGSGKVSDGDARFVGEPVGSDEGVESPRGITSVDWRMEVFDGGEFVPVELEEVPVPASAMVSALEDGGLGFESRIDTNDVDEVLDGEASDREEFNLNVDLLFEDLLWAVNADPAAIRDAYEMGGPAYAGEFPIPLDNSAIERIEVTQSVQNRKNGVQLVQDKETLARVYVDNPESTPMTVDVRLVAQTFEDGSWQGIGEKSETGFDAPPSPDRTQEDDTANFELPADWRRRENLGLTAYVSRPGHYSPEDRSSNVYLFTLEDVDEPNIYVTRLNVSLDRPSAGDLTAVENAFENISPLGNVTFPEIGMNEFGVLIKTDKQGIISELNDYVASRTSWSPPMNQLHGLTPNSFGGGLSDPPWSNGFLGLGSGQGDALVSWGSLNSTSGELVMAHEINHNLGPGNLISQDNWGLHVDGGCGTDDKGSVDGNFPQSDGSVGEVGWTPTHGIVPSSYPDVMTYCSNDDPDKWMSEYRWDHLRQSFVSWPGVSTAASAGVEASEPGPQQQPAARVISGFLYADEEGTLEDGELKPSFEIPVEAAVEQVEPETENPQATVEIDYLDADSVSVPIEVGFTPLESDDDATKRSFTLRVPEEGTVTQIVLRDRATESILDALEGRPFELTEATGLGLPAAFERGRAYEVPVTVDTEDGFEPTHRRLFYRTREDEGWKPWGRPFTGDTVAVEFTTEPGGADGQFMLLASNGLTTRRVVSSSFELAHREPDVEIPRGQQWVVDYEEDDDVDDAGGGPAGDKAVDRGPGEARNVAGPVEATAGGSVSVRARGTDERGVPLPPRALEWIIEDDREREVPAVGSQVGERLSHRFARPGTYTISVTGTDPETGLSATDEIDVEVNHPPLPDIDTLRKFRGESGVDRYANEEGVVETEGLREAIGDWRNGDAGTDLLREVIAAWRSG